MEFDAICEKVAGVPYMDAHHGQLIYDYVRATRPACTLELGTAHGVSAGYIAAALDANDHGRLGTVDVARAEYEPGPEMVFGDLGLDHRVAFVRVPNSSYNWMLRGLVAERSDDAGNCEPLYDFAFIAGGL
jgi:predicted O-methyltransferase YrrM